MFAVVKPPIEKPIRRKDFRLPTGELPAPNDKFVWYDSRQSLQLINGERKPFYPYYGYWMFKNISIKGCLDLVFHGHLAVVQRAELKIELHHRFRIEDKVFSKAWHLASMMQSDIADAELCQSFYNKIENRLQVIETETNKKLSDTEVAAIWAKIEASVPRPQRVVGSE